jgi:hypothetical protein
MKFGDWVKERVREIQAAHPVEDWEDRKCDFEVVVDADGDVRLSGDTRVRFSLSILTNVGAMATPATGSC